MNGIGNVPGKSIDIVGVSGSIPFSMSQVTPSPVTWPADGTHAFNLYYNVYDQYGNPLDGANISVASNTGELFFTSTANGGIAYTQYGPKDAYRYLYDYGDSDPEFKHPVYQYRDRRILQPECCLLQPGPG